MAGEIPESGPARYEYLVRRLAESREQLLITPLDHINLNRLGAALQELSQCERDDEAIELLAESIEVLRRARNLYQDRNRAHETLWLLGSAYTYRASIPSQTTEMKNADTAHAHAFFRQARDIDHDNDVYRLTDPRDQIQNFFIQNWGWGVAAATTLAGLCAIMLRR